MARKPAASRAGSPYIDRSRREERGEHGMDTKIRVHRAPRR